MTPFGGLARSGSLPVGNRLRPIVSHLSTGSTSSLSRPRSRYPQPDGSQRCFRVSDQPPLLAVVHPPG